MNNYQENYRQYQYERRRKKKLYKLIISFILVISSFLLIVVTINKVNVDTNLHGKALDSSLDNENYSIDIPNRDELIQLADEYPDLKEILKNSDIYPDELLEVIARNPETIDFVKDYPAKYPIISDFDSIDIDDDYQKGEIPHFMQWDKRWGYYDYGNSLMALSGCGPTTLSMVIVGLTGNTEMNPKVVADYSYDKGYYVEGSGTSWSLMSEGAEDLGLQSEVLPLNENIIKSNLRDKKPIIVSVRKGDFTTTGHFIILTGVTDEGKITVKDPNSIEKSNKEWDIDVLMSQINNLWAFSKQ